MTEETRKALDNYIRCYKDALDLRTLMVHSKNKSYCQIEVNNIIGQIYLDIESGVVLDADSLQKQFSKRARKVAHERIFNRIDAIKRYQAIFVNEPIWSDMKDDLISQSAQPMMKLFNMGLALELTL